MVMIILMGVPGQIHSLLRMVIGTAVSLEMHRMLLIVTGGKRLTLQVLRSALQVPLVSFSLAGYLLIRTMAIMI